MLGDEYEAWIAAGSEELLPDHKCGTPLLYTGGTTGRSKGVTRSDQHRLVSSYSTVYRRWGDLARQPAKGRAMVSTPLYHALGNVIVQSAIARRQSLTILGRFDPEATLRAIDEGAITAMVPTQFIRLLKLEDEVKAKL